MKKYVRPDRQYRWRKIRKCPVCDNKFMPYTKNSVYCSSKCHNRVYMKWVKKQPLKYKAHKLASKHKGITRKMVETLLKKHIDKPCDYCEQKITIENASIDHKSPFFYRKKKTDKQIKNLNNLNNIQIICRRCNFLKLDLTDNEYKELIKFFHNNPIIEQKLLKRVWKKY